MMILSILLDDPMISLYNVYHKRRIIAANTQSMKLFSDEQVEMYCNKFQTLSIENDPDKIVTFDERSKRFEVIWNDESKINAEYYETENRLPVDLID